VVEIPMGFVRIISYLLRFGLVLPLWAFCLWPYLKRIGPWGPVRNIAPTRELELLVLASEVTMHLFPGGLRAFPAVFV
ncbi:hypothetical protein PIB30_104187, partial [Stylosanthes scabra]|nr:hypothetical protein [Stylosanthes scabra]